jgi:hypothetical protein
MTQKAEKPLKRRKVRTQQRPMCPEHKYLMVRYSGGKNGVFRYYRCPVAECGVTAKQLCKDEYIWVRD